MEPGSWGLITVFVEHPGCYLVVSTNPFEKDAQVKLDHFAR